MGGNVTILVLEDNPTNAMMIKRIVQKVADAKVGIAQNGADALVLCHAELFSLLIVDQILPGGVTGLQFIRAVRLLDRYQNTPIVMVSADKEPRLRVEAVGMGIAHFAAKPLDVVSLRIFLCKLYSLGRDNCAQRRSA